MLFLCPHFASSLLMQFRFLEPCWARNREGFIFHLHLHTFQKVFHWKEFWREDTDFFLGKEGVSARRSLFLHYFLKVESIFLSKSVSDRHIWHSLLFRFRQRIWRKGHINFNFRWCFLRKKLITGTFRYPIPWSS